MISRLIRLVIRLTAIAVAITPWSERTSAQATRPKSTATIASEVTPATVTIIAIDAAGDTLGQGSGFIVRSNGTIVTNWHVLAGASSAVVVLSTRERFERVTFMDGDQHADVAIIKIPGFDLPIVQTRSTTPAVGERVITIGSPLGLSNTVGEGIVSAVRLVDGRELVQISAPISHGSSGGAVADADGRVFAVSTLFLEKGQQLNFAVPVKYAMGLLSEAGTPRGLAEVFATNTHPEPTTVGARANASAPTPTSTPRGVLRGLFYLNESWSTARDSGAEIGFLIIGEHTRMLVVGVWNGPTDSLSQIRTLGVRSFRSVPDGRISADMGGVIFDGYQTEDGFYLQGTRNAENGPIQFEMTGSPTTLELSNSIGLYRVTSQTEYRSGSYRGRYTNWVGEAAIVVHSDSVYIDMYMGNDAGGDTGISGRAALDKSGRFKVEDKKAGVRLEGTIRAGILQANWRDERDGGARYEGSLRAERL